MEKLKIGLDLDGVLVDKPPFVPKKLLEWLVRSHKNKYLSYRFPNSPIEQWLRIFSHHPILRPPIKENLEFIKSLVGNQKYRLYLISGRYSFLRQRTQQWLKYHEINNLFKKVLINNGDNQPHLFKEKTIKNLGIDIFVDDDLPLAEYLAQKTKVKVFCFDQKRKNKPASLVFLIESLKQIFSQ